MEEGTIYEGRIFRIEIARLRQSYKVYISFRSADGILSDDVDESPIFADFDDAYAWAIGSITEMQADLKLVLRDAGEAV